MRIMSSKSGFNLIEVMFACTIFAFLLSASLHTYLNVSQLVTYSRDKTIATTHAKCILEEIRDDITAIQISDGDWLTWLNGLAGVDLLPSETISIEDRTDPLEVPVTISWKEINRDCSITLIGGFQA